MQLELDEPTFSEEPSFAPSRAGGLAARRKKGRPSLDVDAIVEGSQDSLPKPTDEVQASFRGYLVPGSPELDISNTLKTLPPATLRVMSYNVLAARYVSTDKYRFCPTWALAEPYRAANIINEISGAKPDIIFFQELSSEMHTAPCFGERLRSREFGYDSFHLPISDKQGKSHALASSGSGVASSMSSAGSYTNERSSLGARAPVVKASRGSDAAAANSAECNTAGGGIPLSENASRPEFEGVAIFFNKERFEVQEHLPVKFNNIACRDSNLEIAERNRVAIRSHNVGVISVLKDRRMNLVYVCACTHAFWDWTRPECQLWQMIAFLKEIEELEATYSDMGFTCHVIFGADLNAQRDSVSLAYALTQSVPPDTPPQCCFQKYRGTSHGLQLQSVYDDYMEFHPDHVSSTGPTFQGVIDYLLVSKSMEVLAVGWLAPAKDIPSVDVPSDHYPVSAVLIPG